MRIGATRILRHRRRSFVAARMARACGRVAKASPKKTNRKVSDDEAKAIDDAEVATSVSEQPKEEPQNEVIDEADKESPLKSAKPETTTPVAKLPEVIAPFPDVNMEQLLEEFMTQEDKSEDGPLSPMLTASVDDTDDTSDVELPSTTSTTTTTTNTSNSVVPESRKSWPIDRPADSLTFSILNNPTSVTVTQSMRQAQQAAMPEASSEESQAAFDDYFDYESMCEEDSSADEATTPASSPKKSRSSRMVPLCGFRDRFTETYEYSQLSSASKMNSRRLLAAWQTVYPDITHQSWQTYTQAVLLAAASMNQTSLTSGRARETMV